MKKLAILISLMFGMAFIFTGCREDKSAAEKMEDGIEQIGEGAEEVGEDIEEGVEEMEEEVEDSIDD